MSLPKILFHGTSYYRYRQIEADGMLKASMPRGLISKQKNDLVGYVYFTDDINEAYDHACKQVLIDEMTPKAQELAKKGWWQGLGTVLFLKTSQIKDRVELDEAGNQLYQRVKDCKEPNFFIVTTLGKPYRVKGDVSRKYLLAGQTFSLGDNSHKVIPLQMTLELLIKTGNLKLVEGFDLP